MRLRRGVYTVRSRWRILGACVSADGKTLTVAQSGVNGKGETVKNTLVFEKQ